MTSRDVIEARRRRFRERQPGESPTAFILRGVLELANDYALEHIVVEPETELAHAIDQTSFLVEQLTLIDAKERLLVDGPRRHRELYQHVLAEHPKLERLVPIRFGFGAVRQKQKRTVTLSAVAIGMIAGNGRTLTNS